MQARRFDISYASGIGGLLAVMGLGRRWSGVEVDDQTVAVSMGWGFQARVPRASIQSAERHRAATLSIGIHGFAGSWLVNGSTGGLVRMRIDPPTRAWAIGMPVRLSTLTISLDDPDGFLQAVAPARDEA